jgi:hypothetical protein
VVGLRCSPVRGYAAGMLQTDRATKVKLSLPPYVAEMLTGWAVFELQMTPEEVLEAWPRSCAATSSFGSSWRAWCETSGRA